MLRRSGEPKELSFMKTNLLLTSAMAAWLGFAGLSAAAETSAPADRVTFKAGKVLAPVEGRLVEATADISLPNSVVVQTNGVFTVGKGKSRQMREGQVIDAQGMLTSPDGSVVPVFDHITLRKGRVQIVTDGEVRILAGEQALPDGGKVLADGTVRRGGSMQRLLDGQLLRLDGSAVAVTDTISMTGGKVVLFKDGGKVDVRRGQVIAMSDGTKVNGDGSVIRPNGARVVLKEGDTLKIPGVSSSGR